MTGPNDAPAGLRVRLPSGTRILLRPITPADRQQLHRGMAALSAIARRNRFFSAIGDLGEDLVSYLTEIDYRSHFAWVAVDLDRPGQPVVAVGRYVSLEGSLADEALADARPALVVGPVLSDGGPPAARRRARVEPSGGNGLRAPVTVLRKVAEVAFVVGDDYQDQGLATMLLELLTIVAGANGIDHFFARVLEDNTAMRHVLTKAGARLRPDEAGVLRTTFDLPATTGRFPAPKVRAIARSAARAAAAAHPAVATSTDGDERFPAGD